MPLEEIKNITETVLIDKKPVSIGFVYQYLLINKILPENPKMDGRYYYQAINGWFSVQNEDIVHFAQDVITISANKKK